MKKHDMLSKTNTIEELYEGMMQHPYNSDEYEAYKSAIKRKLSKDPKNNEYILCFNSGLTGVPMSEKVAKIFNSDSRISRGNFDVLDNPYSFPEYFGKDLYMLKRNEIEYNIDFKQLCVAVVIKHGDKLVLLQNTENHRLANKVTMIQGHVDYSPEIYRMTMMDYLKRTIIKELQEEVKGLEDVKELDKLLLPRMIMNDKFGSTTSLEHVGVIFTLILSESFDISKVVSNEPEKHTVKIFEKDNIGEIDRWLELALPFLN